MEVFWWTLFVLAITFYTLWATGIFKKKNKDNDDKKQ